MYPRLCASPSLNQGTFGLMFSETMYGALFRRTTFKNSIFSSSPVSLTGGSVIDSTSPIIEIQLSFADLNNLRLQGICTNAGDCVHSTFLTDFAGNPVQSLAVTVFDGSIIPLFTPDRTSPVLMRFELDLENSRLSLSFDEPVGMVIVNERMLQDAFNAS